MNFDKYNEVINGEDTYKQIANILLNGDTVGIGWTDEKYTHLDIIFHIGIEKFGIFQRGIKDDYLFVSIIDHTSFAFRTDNIKLGGYIQEKLRMNNDTGDKLAELINGVIQEINNLEKAND